MYAETPPSALSNPAARQYATAPGQGYDAGAPPAQYAQPQAGAYAAAPAPAPQAAQRPRRTGFVTGAYMPSGDYAIDRMLQLERALKQNIR